MNAITATVATLCAATLAACAPSADSILPTPMGNAYAGMTCQQAAAQRVQVVAALSALTSAQQNAAAGDAIGVFLIGIPVASLTGGDKSGAISVAKGSLVALDARLASCAQ